MEELFSGIIPIIIIIAVVKIIVGVMKQRAAKAKHQQQDGDEQYEQPYKQPQPRQTGMSDIQRAFMMMSGLDNEQEQAPRPYSTEGVRGRTEGTASREGTRGRTEGKSSHEGTHGGHHEGRGIHEGRGSHEGTRAFTSAAAARSTIAPAPGKYANVKIDNYFMDESDDDDIVTAKTRKSRQGTLKLFENQSDYAKAVIYSEILTRRSARR